MERDGRLRAAAAGTLPQRPPGRRAFDSLALLPFSAPSFSAEVTRFFNAKLTRNNSSPQRLQEYTSVSGQSAELQVWTIRSASSRPPPDAPRAGPLRDALIPAALDAEVGGRVRRVGEGMEAVPPLLARAAV